MAVGRCLLVAGSRVRSKLGEIEGVGRRGTPYLVRSADDGDQAEWGVVRGMATLQDLEVGDEVTVTRSRLRDPSTDQIRGMVASVDGVSVPITLTSRLGRRLPACDR
jgi:hypothetical protein